MEGFITLFIIGCIYLLPTIIAYNRKNNNTASIFILNLFLWWTFLWWILSLVWAYKN